MHSAEGTVEQYAPSMTSIDLNRFRLRPGETRREEIEVEVLPFLLGGERYEPAPARLPAVLVASEASGGTLFTLESSARLSGPCMRCLGPAHVDVEISAREFHDPDGGEGLRSDYVVDDRLELTAWARDSIGVELPDQVLCRPDCAGLCPVCGRDLNVEPHEHADLELDPRWAPLEQLRDEA